MNRYVIRRLLQAVPVLLLITVIVFTFTELAPGDAVTAMLVSDLGIMMGPDDIRIEALRRQYGLDKPAWVRYLKWLGAISRGNLGVSIVGAVPVSKEIMTRLPATLQLMGTVMILSLAIGIPLGIANAVWQYSWLDNLTTTLSYLAIALPDFWLAIGLVFLFALRLEWLPSFGYSTPGREFGFWDGLLDRIQYMLLPTMALTMGNVAGIMRYTCSSMLQELTSDYVTVARSKGLKDRVVFVRHALRNALLPLITLVGLRLPGLFGGALVVETVFNWPGMGKLYQRSVTSLDYPMIMGMGLTSAVLIVGSTLVTDLAYAVVDPRIRYE